MIADGQVIEDYPDDKYGPSCLIFGWKETMVEQRVTHVLEVDGRFIIIENVPARVCLETGGRFFSPETVERLQQTVWGRKKPSRVIETPVFEFA